MDTKKQTLSNLVWRFAERCGAQGVSFVVSIVLARLLAPDVYGTVALVTVFTSILQVFIDNGIGNALIQKKDADDLDFSTIFYFNIVLCLCLYFLMFLSAPFIASFYEMPELTPVVRVLSLTLVISGIKNVQQAYVSRHLMFRKFFFSTLAGTIGAAIIGIALAYFGFGVWALVVQQVFNAAVDTLVLWITVPWRPKKMFSFQRLKKLYSYGWKLLAASLLNTVYSDLRQLIIGKLYSSSDLAYYNRGKQFPHLIVTNINTSIDSVLFPVMSNVQDKREKVCDMTRLSIKVSTYIMAPLMMGLAATAGPLVKVLLTEKWSECIPYLRIFCITYMFYPIHTANLNAIKAMGRSDLYLKLEVTKKAVGMILLLISMNFGVMAMAYSLLISSVTSQIINSWPNRTLLKYGYLEQLKDIMPSVFLALFMGACVYLISYLNLSLWLILIIQVMIGAIIYIAGSCLLKLEGFTYLLGILKPYLQKLKKD